MRYLIDTNCCIYLFNTRYQVLRDRMMATEAGEIALSVVVLAELGVGAVLGKAPQRDQLARLREELPILSFEEQDSDVYARLPFRRGRFDALIAAQAISRGLTLITANERDFADVPGLKIENWTLPL
jgi:tRNA(fMet)-specific endonuclease VapC